MIAMVEGAEFSPCQNYRYVLARPCGGPFLDGPLLRGTVDTEALRLRTVMWVMLNPSTATATADDATIRKVRTYSAAMGAWRFLVVNLFAWRSTEPAGLLKVADPVGPRNDVWIQGALASASMVVAAWGSVEKVRKLTERRAPEVLTLLRRTHPVHALAFNGDGGPSHPLYLDGMLRPVPWKDVLT